MRSFEITFPTCGSTWSGCAILPGIDLSRVAGAEALEETRVEPFAEYQRLSELVRPLLPTGVAPAPGMQFGPLPGKARGAFGPVTMRELWEVLLREDAVERLRAAGLQGIDVVSADLRGLESGALPLFELAPPRTGRLHPDCILEGGPPCRTCGWQDVSLLPQCWLDVQALPSNLDAFRLENAELTLVVSERFVDCVGELGSSDVKFQEAGLGPPPSLARSERNSR